MRSRSKVSTTRANKSYSSMRHSPRHFAAKARLIPIRMRRRQMRQQHAPGGRPQREPDTDPFSWRFPTQNLGHRLVHDLYPAWVQGQHLCPANVSFIHERQYGTSLSLKLQVSSHDNRVAWLNGNESIWQGLSPCAPLP